MKKATKLAKICSTPKKDVNDPLFAVQMFIEDLVLPNDCSGYNEKSMKEFILTFLRKK